MVEKGNVRGKERLDAKGRQRSQTEAFFQRRKRNSSDENICEKTTELENALRGREGTFPKLPSTTSVQKSDLRYRPLHRVHREHTMKVGKKGVVCLAPQARRECD